MAAISGRGSATRYADVGVLPITMRRPPWSGLHRRGSSSAAADGRWWSRCVCQVALALIATTVLLITPPTSALAAACAPRPPDGVRVGEVADGRFEIVVRAGSGTLHEIRLGTAQGATVTLPAGTAGPNGPLPSAQLQG